MRRSQFHQTIRSISRR